MPERIQCQLLHDLVIERMEDAESLFNANRYDAAIYLCGYALECCLKEQICIHNSWSEYVPLPGKYTNLFYNHDLDVLEKLSGKSHALMSRVHRDRMFVKDKWNPENRYQLVKATEDNCRYFIDATKNIIKEISAIC